MKVLSDILKEYKYELVNGSEQTSISGIAFDSRKVQEKTLFVAIKGAETDGHRFINNAIKAGASAIICEDASGIKEKNATVIRVQNSRDALAWLSAAWYNYPSDTMKVIGITGTNGKTTTATMLYNVFRELGYPCGLFSTVKILINGQQINATHTTPDPLAIQGTMAEMRDAGCEYCFMEVSSHAVDQDRVKYIDFASGVFTNITQDHLDYHKTFKNYIEAKQKFFTHLSKDAKAIYNADDKNGSIMVQNTKAKRISYSLKKPSDHKAKIIKKEMDGMMLQLEQTQMWTMLTGLFNAYNLMAVYSTAIQFYNDSQELLRVISKQKPVRGRFEHIMSAKGTHGIIDYAHTPDAVENVLSTVDEVRTGNEQLIVIIGAGGNRDKTKRPIMAQKACRYADTVVFTSDNPRNEDPEAIIQDMKTGIPVGFTGREFTIESREEAIKVAVGLSSPGDIIVIAGKGHETYQEVKGKRHHFDDREILMKHFK